MTMSSTRGLPPSARGMTNIANAGVTDMEDDLDDCTFYDPVTNPSGLIMASGASNDLMDDWLETYSEKFGRTFKLSESLAYGGVIGPEKLAKAVAHYVNRKFAPSTLISAEHILPTNGVSSLLDMVAFNVCDQGEGIMFTTPTYSMFGHDLYAKAGTALIPVATDHITDQFSASCAATLLATFERVYRKATSAGTKIKAVLLCNPSNPVGRFYSKETLLAIAGFCGRRKLHLVSDEIYAMSGFASISGQPALDGFTSVLSLKDDPKNFICTENIHALYGSSKDFAMGGLRLGFLITRNTRLWKACRRCAVFTWVSPFSTEFFTNFIGNDAVVDSYLQTYQTRLREKYLAVAEGLKSHNIPFDPANACLFVWLDLSHWLKYFDGPDRPGIVTKSIKTQEQEEITRERHLGRHLIQHGVYLSAGELSASPTPGRFRFVYTSQGDQAMIVVERIREALNDLERSSAKYRHENAVNEGMHSDEDSISNEKYPRQPSQGSGRASLSRAIRAALCF
ncbi:hypothetical protein PFICI_08549 [Pestalotiopsis fici W106-1]|uniref:Aminotransferase class I/classII large domain-containing protein n=1 Tax=Pestalotiopsis fici (strain W106-1 / CGMCC3.15140) TaxID=1229662 RepID=W3X0N6_PESFW|nr:uncharacterized protein PFICI_08549 [Pestalotiopsis fici W106-1]ETS78696.1 hypothetical protein PFICI_08549 [Pestalotiopsis fici W106-1]